MDPGNIISLLHTLSIWHLHAIEIHGLIVSIFSSIKERIMGVLGIDIGGSGIKGAIIDVETGEFMTERHRIPTPEEAKPADVADTLKELVDHFQYEGPVGSGFPAVVLHGVTMTAANVHQDWIGTNAEALFHVSTGQPVYVANDADVAGLAEVKFGAGKGVRGTILVLTLGTGVGSAIFVDGVLLPNTEFGHLKIRKKDAELRSSDGARQRKGYSYEKWAEKLNEHISELEALLWPDLIIIGGGVSKHHEEYFPYLKTRAQLVPAELLNQAGIVGAALYAHERHQALCGAT
jgi:polyphosphate glucokinase